MHVEIFSRFLFHVCGLVWDCRGRCGAPSGAGDAHTERSRAAACRSDLNLKQVESEEEKTRIRLRITHSATQNTTTEGRTEQNMPITVRLAPLEPGTCNMYPFSQFPVRPYRLPYLDVSRTFN